VTSTPETAALAYARTLDARVPRADGREHQALLEIGDLCGGLSARGIAAELRAWLEDEDAGVLVGPWCILSRRPEDKAAWWHEQARLAMAEARMEVA
jgi:hypothetical protein